MMPQPPIKPSRMEKVMRRAAIGVPVLLALSSPAPALTPMPTPERDVFAFSISFRGAIARAAGACQLRPLDWVLRRANPTREEIEAVVARVQSDFPSSEAARHFYLGLSAGAGQGITNLVRFAGGSETMLCASLAISPELRGLDDRPALFPPGLN